MPCLHRNRWDPEAMIDHGSSKSLNGAHQDLDTVQRPSGDVFGAGSYGKSKGDFPHLFGLYLDIGNLWFEHGHMDYIIPVGIPWRILDRSDIFRYTNHHVYQSIWRFPEMGVPLIIHVRWECPWNKPTSFWGPPFMETTIHLCMYIYIYIINHYEPLLTTLNHYNQPFMETPYTTTTTTFLGFSTHRFGATASISTFARSKQLVQADSLHSLVV